MKIIFGFFAILLSVSCSLEKLGSSTGQGPASKSDTIGSNVVHGALLGLTDPFNQQRLRKFVDSIVASMGDTLLEICLPGKNFFDS